MSKHFYIIGGGICGLNAALLLMKQGVPGKDISIFEGNKECGGLFYRDSSDNGRSFYAHTVRTFDEPSYHYTQRAWRQAGIWNNDHLITRNLAHPRETIPAHMRTAFLSIAMKSDEELEHMSIADLLPNEITKTHAFRYFFHLTGLSEHHSALSLKRYMTHTHGNIPNNWVLRSATCDYESIIEPIVAHLKQQGVTIEYEKMVKKLHIKDKHVHAIDDLQLEPDDKVIVTLGANVGKELLPEQALIHDRTATPINPDIPFENSIKQPHSSVWVLAHEDIAAQIEARFPGSTERDFIHTDVEHPWQITLISLGNKYYRDQPEKHRLFYIAMNDLSKKGLHIKKSGVECTNEELSEEVLKRLNIWDIVQHVPDKYTATVDTRARQHAARDSAPIVRFMPGEAEKILVYPDTHCDNLAVAGERVKAYLSPVPTTEWVTETGHRAIQYLLYGIRCRKTAAEYEQQEKMHTWRFVKNWFFYKLGLSGPNFKSSVSMPHNPTRVTAPESHPIELKSLLELINDSDYWLTKSKFSSQIPQGLLAMQQLITAEENRSNPEKLFTELKAVADQQLNKEKSFSCLFFGYDPRDRITYEFYQALRNSKNLTDILNTIHTVQEDWLSFQENLMTMSPA